MSKDTKVKDAPKGSSPQDDGNTTNAAVQDGKPAPTIPPDAEPRALARTNNGPKGVEVHGATRGTYQRGDDVGTGFEDFTQDDLAVPFIALLQKGSPQVEEDNPKRIEGAKGSMFMNTVTQKLWDGKAGIVVIPVHRTRSFIEWIPKDDGGGLVNVFQPDAPEVRAVLAKAGKKFGKLKIGDNNDLAETFNVFCLLVGPDGKSTERVVISFASSQIGGYKKWMTMAQSIQVPSKEDPDRMVNPPMFSHLYRLTSFFFQKKEHTWYKMQATFAYGDAEKSNLPEGSPLFEAAKEFRALVLSGAASANFESAVQDGGDAVAEAEYEM
jgi:hypothetical protein